MEPKLKILFLSLVTLVLICFTKAVKADSNLEKMAVSDTPTPIELIVDANLDDTIAKVSLIFSDLLGSVTEHTYLNSKLVSLDKGISRKLDITKLVISKMEEKYFPSVANIKNEEYRNTFIFRLVYIENRETPSFKMNGEFATLQGSYLIVIRKLNEEKSMMEVIPNELEVLASKKCGLSLHGFSCGRESKSVDNDLYEQNRIMMYLLDGFKYLKTNVAMKI